VGTYCSVDMANASHSRFSCSARAVQNNLGLVVFKDFRGHFVDKMYVWPDGDIMSQNTHVTTVSFNK